MKESKVNSAAQTPVFPVVIRKRRTKLDAAVSNGKPEKRDNVFSKSRDTREDRGARQVKTASNPQTFPHGR
jgi:hypothetical protein